MNRTRRNFGGALASTLLIVLLLFIFGLTLANLATFDLRIVNKHGERQKAFEAAEAGLSRVMTEISRNPAIGTNNEVFQATLSNGTRYRISFATSGPGIKSLNNLAGLTGKFRGTDAVPPSHALLVAEGTSKAGETAAVETLIRLEALPYALAATRMLQGSGVTVFGAYTGAEARAAQASGAQPLIGHTYSGSTAANSTILTSSNVSGDIRSVGGANVAGTVVGGTVETNQDPDDLPDFDINRFDPSLPPPGNPALVAGPTGSQLLPGLLTGVVRIGGDVNFLTGVVMTNATVFVDGDFTATTLVGTGTLFVTGETTITAALQLTGASNRLTIFSEKDINLGLGGLFQGVFLTHGNFTTNGALIVLGAVYANSSADPTKGNVALNALTSVIIHVQEYTAFASYWLALGGEAKPIQVYWNQLY